MNKHDPVTQRRRRKLFHRCAAALSLTVALSAGGSSAAIAQSARPSGYSAGAASHLVDELLPQLEDGVRSRLLAGTGSLHVAFDESGAPVPCGPSQIELWASAHQADWTAQDHAVANYALGVNLYYPVYFGDEGEDPAQTLRRNIWHKTSDFWSMPPSAVRLLVAHSDTALDPTKTARVLVRLGAQEPIANQIGVELAAALQTSKFDFGRNPLLSSNAVSVPGSGPDGPAPAVVVGDGLVTALGELVGVEDAFAAIVSHEYAHQVQFAHSLYDFSAGGVRRSELLADAFGTYFLTHPKGASFQEKRAKEVLADYYALGDCLIDSPLHHGTPAERWGAGSWAYRVEEETTPRSRIIPAEPLAARFVAEYLAIRT